jgi:hypothetical protein
MRRVLGLLLLVTGCNGDSGANDMGPPPPTCSGALSFGTPQNYLLPTGYAGASFGLTAESPSCGPNGLPTYASLDIDGDGRPDLVVTQLCGDLTVGNSRWIVHRGQDGGFAAPQNWLLPTGYAGASFGLTSQAQACGPDGLPSYAFVDVTGDKRPDLVITSLCGDLTVGNSRWIVHRGQDGGFGPAENWLLPTGYAGLSFTSTSAFPNCGPNGLPTFSLYDITGDQRPDIVIGQLCGDTTVGNSRWIVHRGQDGGFGTAENWLLPTGYAGLSFTGPLGTRPGCGPNGLPTYSLSDIDGDRRPDIVVTQLCGDLTVGNSRWIVHPGQDGSFGAATNWLLPTGYAGASFGEISSAGNCGPNGLPTYTLTDVTGDRVPDLVVTSLCGDLTVGNSRWLLHRGQSGGFAAVENWLLPTGYAGLSFSSLAEAPSCGPNGLPTYSLADFNNDQLSDLVITQLCGDLTVGNSRWIVHPLSCAP